jgi:hypothetical protein
MIDLLPIRAATAYGRHPPAKNRPMRGRGPCLFWSPVPDSGALVAQDLRSAMLQRRYADGTRIPSEAELANAAARTATATGCTSYTPTANGDHRPTLPSAPANASDAAAAHRRGVDVALAALLTAGLCLLRVDLSGPRWLDRR